MTTTKVTVVGYGAMGSGMAQRLASLPQFVVNVYDVRPAQIQAFQSFKHALDPVIHPATTDTSLTLTETARDSDIVVICVLNDKQCDSVLSDIVPSYSATDEDIIAPTPSTSSLPVTSIVVTATVPPSYMKKLPNRMLSAFQKSESNSRQFNIIDSPISGGPVRSAEGSLTIMASAPPTHMSHALPTLAAMSNAVPGSGGLTICGDFVGAGMIVKICHQLIAGCNLVAAAEGFTLAKKMGVLNDALKEVCFGGAANSTMMRLRGERIEAVLNDPSVNPPTMSSCNVWTKDLGIVKSLWEEANAEDQQKSDSGGVGRLISAALETFQVAAKNLNLGNEDDSTLVKLYDSATAPPVTSIDVSQEPVHSVTLHNKFAKVLVVRFAEGHETQIHRHSVDSFYFFLSPPIVCGEVGGGASSLRGIKALNTKYGQDGKIESIGFEEMDYGECRMGDHCTTELVHKIKCVESGSGLGMFCVDIEFLQAAPASRPLPTQKPSMTLIKERPKANIYQIVIAPSSSFTFDFDNFYILLTKVGGEVAVTKNSATWPITTDPADSSWIEPGSVFDWKNNNASTDIEVFMLVWKN